VSLLSYFSAEDATRKTLEAVAASGDDEVRRQAIYTLGRGFGARADEALVRFIEACTGDAKLAVAEHAVRALRWVDHPEAERALERLAKSGPSHLKTLARTTIDKRVQRMKAPKRGH
jgi:HEAT repeat protein